MRKGETLVFMVSAAPVPSAALRVRLAVTETVDALAGSAPSSVPIPAGRGSVELDSSSTVSPEVRRPGSNKIMTLGGD